MIAQMIDLLQKAGAKMVIAEPGQKRQSRKMR